MRRLAGIFAFIALLGTIAHTDRSAPAAPPTSGEREARSRGGDRDQARGGGAPRASERWFSYVQVLASDDMAGRNTGSAEHKRAAEFVASEFRKAGLEPAGVGGYIQPVAFRTRRIVEARSSLALVREGNTAPLTLGAHAHFSVRIGPAAVLPSRCASDRRRRARRRSCAPATACAFPS